ncbi:hypothetical protein SNE40_011831 [Patella caerulea]|uniref:Major facilitator superfamily (MFS) profile domain-containing protein n=1 Tax=Patella caerulea TaxID=87958 RepID=A0AAN8JQ49_PATCE
MAKCFSKRWGTLAGGFLIHMATCIPFIFGNLSTYFISLMHRSGFFDVSQIGNDTWILGLFNAILFISMLITELIVGRFGYRITLVIANVIFSCGCLFTYFTIQHSIWMTSLTFGIICGFGAGISIVTTLDLASRWFPSCVTTVCGVLISGFSFGGLVWNWMLSYFVNPDNLTPNQNLGYIRVFNQTEILDRVPNVFLLLGTFTSVVQFIGIALAFTPPSVNYEDLNLHELNNDRTSALHEKSLSSMEQSKDGRREYTPLQVLKDPGAYIQWITLFTTLVCLLGVQVSYKSFGQTFIRNDHFIAYIGSVAAIGSSIYRIVISVLADIISIKLLYIVGLLVGCIFLTTLHQTIDMGNGWFCLWILILESTLSTPLAFAPSIVQYTYGTTNFKSNFSLIWSAASLSGLGGPVLLGGMLKSIGWTTRYYILSGVCGIGFLASIFIRIPFCIKKPPSPDPTAELSTTGLPTQKHTPETEASTLGQISTTTAGSPE